MTGPTIPRTGLLTLRVSGARGLSLPGGESVPPLIQQVLSTQQGKDASSVTLRSTSQAYRLARKSGKSKTLRKKQYWWLPYIILEFDKDEILITSVGGTMQEPVWMFQAHFDGCRVSEIALRLYLQDGTKINHLTNDESRKSDMFMGDLKFVPDFDRRGTADRWYDVSNGSGQVSVAVTFRPSTTQSLSIEDFDLLKVIGKGSYGRIMQVKKKDTSRLYALKSIRKVHLALRSEITHTLVERTVLAKVNSPFIVPLKFSFQKPAKLYLVLPFINGGELFYHLQREQRFDEERSRFYAGEILLALEHLHGLDVVVYRDLKAENILLDYTGHIALCDFGLCKFHMPDHDTTDTFYGLEYLAPEVLLGRQYSKTSDWWTLGLFLYEMLTGLPPFYDENQYEMYRKIVQDPLRFGDESLGVNGADEIKRHPFFSKYIDFDKLLAKKIQPPVAGTLYTSDFDQVFTPEHSSDFVVPDLEMSETVRAQFEGFSYNGEADALNESGRSYAA